MPGLRPIVILGPTAGGKSSLAVALATTHAGTGPPGEIVSADSMQVYRHLDAGTAKPTPDQRDAVPHHLIDVVDPSERFTVADWLERADAAIADIQQRGRRPIVVGGTNLYLKALLEGLFDGPPPDDALRRQLQRRPPAELHARLAAVDPDAAGRITPQDAPRLLRALEVFELTGRPISSFQQQWREASGDPASPVYRHDPVLIGLRFAPDTINPRINQRVKAMFHPRQVDADVAAAVCPAGESLPDEVERLTAGGLLPPASQAAQALGYKQVLAVRRGDDPKLRTMDDAMERTKVLTRRFAKQQRTWLKRFRGVAWLDMPRDDAAEAAAAAIKAAPSPADPGSPGRPS